MSKEKQILQFLRDGYSQRRIEAEYNTAYVQYLKCSNAAVITVTRYPKGSQRRSDSGL